MSLTIQVISPDRVIWNTNSPEVVLPTKNGQLGILKNHTSLITILDIGVLRIRNKEKWIPLILLGGCAEIANNNITILVNGVEEVKEGDIQQLKVELEQTAGLLTTAKTDREKIAISSKAKRLSARIVALTYL